MGRNPHLNELASPKKADYGIAEEQLASLGITELADRDYTESSGGERQLVLFAWALAQRAPMLLMDEPTAHLDYGNEVLILEQITKLKELGYTIANDTYYEVPGAPYNWISRPPGPNRIVGINWMGQLLYPEYFDNDIVEETKEFYELFYRYELSDDEVQEIFGNSTLE